jgi:hypothetical protein
MIERLNSIEKFSARIQNKRNGMDEWTGQGFVKSLKPLSS